jgi:hypothetical protein
MRHIVLGIAAIAAVQLAFQLYMVEDQQPEYAASVAAGRWSPDTIVTARGDLHALTSKADQPTLARARYRKPAERRNAPIRAAYRPAAPRLRTTLTAKAIPKKTPKKVLRPDGPDDDDDDDDNPWIAKALPIVKKPYDWLKALGAKLK